MREKQTMAMVVTPSLVGRAEEAERCRARLRDGGAVLLCGPGGIGKSELLEALVAEAKQAGELVLRTSPHASETDLPYLALLDLFGPVLAEFGGRLPDHLRSALDSALLRSAPSTPTDQLAIRIAVIELLRLLAAERLVLLALDDVQWVDEPSAEVLTFAARRLGGSRVRVLAAERVAGPGEPPTRAGLCPAPVEEVHIGPLPRDLLKELVRQRVPQVRSGTGLDRLSLASGGNPLYALELARAWAHGGVPDDPADPLPVPQRLRQLLAERLGSLPATVRTALLLVAAAGRPDRALLPVDDPGRRGAISAGVLSVDPDGALRFVHPLMAELVYGDATPRARRAAHARLVSRVDDPVERVRHRALASTGPDLELARDLTLAAAWARARGAPGTAAALCRLAASRTSSAAQAAAHLIDAAQHALIAGLSDQVRSACVAVLGMELPAESAEIRVSARLLLAELARNNPSEVRELLAAADADAGDDPLLAGRVQRMRADLSIQEHGIAGSHAEIAEAERLARLSEDDDLLIEALALRIPEELAADDGGELPALDEAIRLAVERPLTEASVWIRQGHTVVQLRRGWTEEAIATITRLRREVEQAGRTRDLSRVLYTVTSVFERAGRCREAADAARLCGLLWTEVDLPPAAGLTLRGAAELNTGTVERALELLEQAVVSGQSTHDPEWRAYAHVLMGRAELIRRDPATAAPHLLRGRELLRDLGYRDPAMILLDSDLVEALAGSGDPGAAWQALAEARQAASARRRDAVRLGLDRAEALIDGLAGDARAAADGLRRSVAAGCGYPLEIARAELTLAQLERRARRRGAARLALGEAIRRYAAAGCEPWLEHARQELSRLDSVDAPESELDRRLVELVTAGVTNHAIAGILHLSVKAVEAHLTRLYRRYGVSSRTDLARQHAEAKLENPGAPD